MSITFPFSRKNVHLTQKRRTTILRVGMAKNRMPSKTITVIREDNNLIDTLVGVWINKMYRLSGIATPSVGV